MPQFRSDTGANAPIKTALAGFGKIARDQHLPAIAANGRFELVAIASPQDRLDGVPSFPDVAMLIRETAGLAAITVCTPPQIRYSIALHALEQGLHVLLEKPPAASVGQMLRLISTAERRRVALLASWHSRYASAVEPARAWLSRRKILGARITWREDARVWHPRQAWLWQPGGLGVFDPGINAISIATRILPGSLVLEDAELDFPVNCATPIAARLRWRGPDDAPVLADFDFRQSGVPTWEIEVVTDSGQLRLSKGGDALTVDDRPMLLAPLVEYAGVYAHFAALVDARSIDADVAPLQHVADVFIGARRRDVEPFLE